MPPAATAFCTIVLLAAGLGGCVGLRTAPTPSVDDSCAARPKPSPRAGGVDFSGDNAFAYVLRIVCDFDAKPPRERPRVPGTPERVAAALYLDAALRAAGWTTRFENFTGLDYAVMDKGSAAPWADDCDETLRARRDGLEFSNVVAERGTGRDLVYFLAHYDSKRAANADPTPENRSRPVLGANDGASGVGVLVEAARVLVPPTNLTARILLVDGEDGFDDCHPLAGSLHHVLALDESERGRLRAAFLLDMVGDPAAVFCADTNEPSLRDRLTSAARRANEAALARPTTCRITDDHTPFVDHGLPALDLIDYRPGFPPYWHTTQDTPDRLAPAMLGSVGRVVVELVRGWSA